MEIEKKREEEAGDIGGAGKRESEGGNGKKKKERGWERTRDTTWGARATD